MGSSFAERENLSPNPSAENDDEKFKKSLPRNNSTLCDRSAKAKPENRQGSSYSGGDAMFWSLANYPLRPASTASVLTEEMFLRANGIGPAPAQNSAHTPKATNGSKPTEGIVSLPIVNAQQSMLILDNQLFPNVHLNDFYAKFSRSPDPQSQRCAGSASSSPSHSIKGYRSNRSANPTRKWTTHSDVSRNNISTPPDRFLNRAHLIELKSEPAQLCNGSKWDPLSKHIWAKFSLRQQREDTYRKKMYLWRYLYTNIKVVISRFRDGVF